MAAAEEVVAVLRTDRSLGCWVVVVVSSAVSLPRLACAQMADDGVADD